MSFAEIYDAGEKFGGAKKDLWKSRGLTSEDIKDFSLEEKIKYVTKQNVWPDNYEQLLANGATLEAVAALKIIKDRIAAKPNPSNVENYVNILSEINKFSHTITALKDLEALHIHIKTFIGYLPLKDRSKLDGYWSIFKGRSDPLIADYAAIKQSKKLLSTGWPKQEPWTKKLKIHHAPHYGGWIILKKDNRFLPETKDCRYQSEDEAKAAAKQAYESISKTKTPFQEPKKPYLENIKRVGEDYRKDKNITPQDLIDTFGFRGIEFGNYANNQERQTSLNYAYDAFLDLAKILDLPNRAISIDGRIGVAFGSRGGGKHSAHYEPDKKVMNLTKLRGAGSVAHEWMHALDHYLGTLNNSNPELIYFSDNVKYSLLDDILRQSYIGIRNALRWADESKTSFSDFYKEACQLCGKSGDYRTQPCEMMARAFESYVSEKLDKVNKKSEFLVSGVEHEYYEVQKLLGIIRGNPYPSKPIVSKLTPSFDKFINSIKCMSIFKHNQNTHAQTVEYKQSYGNQKTIFDFLHESLSLEHLST